jgi:hypothetical protein
MNVRCSTPNQKCHTAGSRLDTLKHRAAVDAAFHNLQPIRVPNTSVFRIGDCTLQDLFQEPSAAIGKIPKGFHAFTGRLTTNQICKRPHFGRRDPGVTMCRSDQSHDYFLPFAP